MPKRKAIEVTQEMIAAGVKVLNARISDAPRIYPDEEIVTMIFDAMLAASASRIAGSATQ